ncbi:unnamed protein product [Ectocarpus sp. CCAP 1310/34]|nr:unnamed protein product [Ectocarpus sp. CCAP 1310/34]
MEGGARGSTGAAAAGLSTTVVPVTAGQIFSSRHAAQVAVAAELTATGRSMKNGKGVGSRQIHLVCKTCTSWAVKAFQQKGGDFNITKVEGSHVDCAGGERTSSAVVQPLVDQTLKTVGFTVVSDRQSQRAKKRIANATKGDEATAISRLPFLFEGIERDCPGSIATVEERMSPDNRFVRSFLMLGKAAYLAAHSVPKASESLL